jgi:hypothetical protein
MDARTILETRRFAGEMKKPGECRGLFSGSISILENRAELIGAFGRLILRGEVVWFVLDVGLRECFAQIWGLDRIVGGPWGGGIANRSVASSFGLRSSLRQSGARLARDLRARG